MGVWTAAAVCFLAVPRSALVGSLGDPVPCSGAAAGSGVAAGGSGAARRPGGAPAARSAPRRPRRDNPPRRSPSARRERGPRLPLPPPRQLGSFLPLPPAGAPGCSKKEEPGARVPPAGGAPAGVPPGRAPPSEAPRSPGAVAGRQSPRPPAAETAPGSVAAPPAEPAAQPAAGPGAGLPPAAGAAPRPSCHCGGGPVARTPFYRELQASVADFPAATAIFQRWFGGGASVCVAAGAVTFTELELLRAALRQQAAETLPKHLTTCALVMFALLCTPDQVRQAAVLDWASRAWFAGSMPMRCVGTAWQLLAFSEPCARAFIPPFFDRDPPLPLAGSIDIRLSVVRACEMEDAVAEMRRRLPRAWEAARKAACAAGAAGFAGDPAGGGWVASAEGGGTYPVKRGSGSASTSGDGFGGGRCSFGRSGEGNSSGEGWGGEEAAGTLPPASLSAPLEASLEGSLRSAVRDLKRLLEVLRVLPSPEFFDAWPLHALYALHACLILSGYGEAPIDEALRHEIGPRLRAAAVPRIDSAPLNGREDCWSIFAGVLVWSDNFAPPPQSSAPQRFFSGGSEKLAASAALAAPVTQSHSPSPNCPAPPGPPPSESGNSLSAHSSSSGSLENRSENGPEKGSEDGSEKGSENVSGSCPKKGPKHRSEEGSENGSKMGSENGSETGSEKSLKEAERGEGGEGRGNLLPVRASRPLDLFTVRSLRAEGRSCFTAALRRRATERQKLEAASAARTAQAAAPAARWPKNGATACKSGSSACENGNDDGGGGKGGGESEKGSPNNSTSATPASSWRPLILTARGTLVANLLRGLDMGLEIFALTRSFDLSGTERGAAFRRLSRERYVLPPNEAVGFLAVLVHEDRCARADLDQFVRDLYAPQLVFGKNPAPAAPLWACM